MVRESPLLSATPLRVARDLVACALLACGLFACGGEPVSGDCRTDGCAAPLVCVEAMGVAECACPAGTRPEAGGCVALTECAEDTCRMRGTCVAEAGAVRCECEPPFAGAECEGCMEGLFDDGLGGRSADPCAAVSCEGDRRCLVVDGEAGCACPAGTHTEGEVCVPDTECGPTTCAGRGTCEARDEVITCTCDEGFSGARCDACDTSLGYHDDGLGGCTTDVCVPNPCAAAHRGVCTTGELGIAECACEAGHHLELDACVPDEVCDAASCNGNGDCSIDAGRTTCACDEGWAGPRCDACDAGYHDDGMGGCTTDVCTPSPCTTAGRGVCSEVGGAASCACDPGLHEDGVGGCTEDPCRPDPCAALGQACRDAAGTAECYTPICDDNNPCTDDRAVGGGCAHDMRPNGAVCSTTICRTGELCMAGACTGGSAVVCDDANPCTRDQCEDPLGCRFVADDALVPDDGLACTSGACASGAATHTPLDARCDDGAWCSGVERCTPGAGADARGCVITDVPVAPGPSGPCAGWECDEPSDQFVRRDRPEGSGCDDTIGCTSGDACQSGACRGAPTGDCSLASCTPGAPTTSLSVEMGAARVRGALVYGGSSTFPVSPGSSSISIYLRSSSTGQHHLLERVVFGGWTGSAYPVASFNELDDRTLDTSVLPGVYDVVYYRNAGSDFIARAANADPYPYARQVIARDLVVGPGENTLSIDLAATRVTGTLRFGGSSTFPVSPGSSSISVYLRSRSTGSDHLLERVVFGGWNGTAYPVASFNELDDRAVDLTVAPGAYDVVYYRNAGSDFIARAANADPYPYAQHVLRENVTIGAGAMTLDVDLAAVRVTGALRHAGSTTFPTSPGSSSISVYLRSRSTGSHHLLERVVFGGWTGSAYPVASFNELDDRAVDLAVLPGAYDVVYYRNAGSDFIARAANADPYPYAQHVLRENVTIGPGATTLDVELGATRVTGALRHGGAAAFPVSPGSSSISVYLRSRSTGMHHLLERVVFGGWNGSAYPVASFNELDDRAVDLTVLPGAYDLVYYRNAGSDFIARAANADPYPYAQHVLRESVVIPAGTASLDVELAATRVTGALVHEASSSFPTSPGSSSVSVYLRSRSTGKHHLLERVVFGGWTGSAYPVASFNELDDRALDLTVLPGTYDVVYYRNAGSDFIARAANADPYPYAQHVIREGVVVPPGSHSLTLDLGAPRVTGALVYAGASAFPVSPGSSSIAVYLRSRSTGMHHLLERVVFGGWNGSAYPVASFNELDDRAIELDVMPGAYDLVYYRNAGSDFIAQAANTDPYPYARHVLAACVALQ